MNSKGKYKEFLNGMIHFCDYRDRCKSEVWTKLHSFELSNEEKNKLFNELIALDVLNEKRFVEAYIGGKTRIKRWGKNKIRASLYAKKIDSTLINESLDSVIDMDEYREQIDQLFTRKWEQLKKKEDLKTRQRIYRYLHSKGYESPIINEKFEKYFKS